MSFSANFKALTGHPPMKWQERLFDAMRAGKMPDALDLPTGLGKTAVMPIWLIARAAGAKVPRRLVYVVDRRAVVDQATVVADQLAERIGDGKDADELITQLRAGLGLARAEKLPVSTLRGQHADNRAWLENPTSPAIVVGTVDMIGSRLLFQGYGVSPRMRPVHAALLACDVLAVLDEAHLVPPFEDLLRSLAKIERPAPVPQLSVLTLSATGRVVGNSVAFKMSAADEKDERASARLRAAKWLRVESTGNLESALVTRAIERAGATQRAIIFCDSRKIAQKVASELKKKNPDVVELLVGARRVHERDELKKNPVFRRFYPQTTAESSSEPAFLVATSAGEVGVDLDADHLICDLVPWERMVQRFGRVNRRANPGEAMIDVFAVLPEKDAETQADQSRLERWRAPFESAHWPKRKDGRLDASPAALADLKQNSEVEPLLRAATTDEPYHPALTQEVLESWAMTSLDDHPGRPAIAGWLRGWVEEEAQTVVSWRLHLPRNLRGTLADEKHLEEFFQAAPPHLTETLEAPTFQIVDLLKKRAAAWKKSATDKDAQAFVIVLDNRNRLEKRFSYFYSAEKLNEAKTDDLNNAFAGRRLVIDARLGGLDQAGLLDEKSATAPSTLDDGTNEEWTKIAGFRVRAAPAIAKDRQWPVAFRWRKDPDNNDGDAEELRVELLRNASTSEGDPAIARYTQSLAEHQQCAGKHARRIAGAHALDPKLEKMLIAAAEAHDEGKRRKLWQDAMCAPKDDRPYAKTKGGGSARALEINGLTYRHELGSVADAANNKSMNALSDDLRELALHLIAAHHGYARPIIAAVDPDVPPSLAIKRAREVAMRYAHLQKRWGVFGLAWWEAMLRAADWAASRALNEKETEQ